MVRSVPEVLYRLAWQYAGNPEHHVFGDLVSVRLLEKMLKGAEVSRIEIRVAEAISARLPAPETELIQSVDHGMTSPQARGHASPRVDEPLIGTESRYLRDRLRGRLAQLEDLNGTESS